MLAVVRLYPRTESGSTRSTTPPCERFGFTPGALAPVRVMVSRSITLNRPHPPHSPTHPDFAAWRVICDAFAVHIRICLGDPRLVLSFHVTIPVTTQTNPARIWTPNIGKKADDLKSIPIPSTSNSVCDIVRPVGSWSLRSKRSAGYDFSGERRFSCAGT